MRRRISRLLLCLGALCLAVSLAALGRELWRAQRAGAESRALLQELLPTCTPAATPIAPPSAAPAPSPAPSPTPTPSLDPNRPMPETEVDGRACIGYLEIPELELVLPVLSAWSYEALREAPCRYSGSLYLDDLVVCAHNYEAHFGRLQALSPGARVRFTDVEGTAVEYAVTETEQLAPTALEELQAGDWDLTLLTCTQGGEARIAVRCARTEDTE